MALEQELHALLQANDKVTGLVNGKVANIDNRILSGQQNINDFITNGKREAPHYRLSKNQRLMGTSGSVPNQWISGDNVTYTLIQNVDVSTVWADRTAIEKELLTAMGRENERYVYRDFNIWQMDWTSASHTHTLYQTVNGSNHLTIAAMTKVLSGGITGYWAEGATNEWKLTGYHYNPTIHRYHSIHPHRQTETGSMLFALPAAITGHLPLEAELWSIFAYIGDTQNG